MKVIPVIDLRAGEVVHARGGHRTLYRPIDSPLCRGSRPADVVGGLLNVFPFDTLYIADLDAIQGEAAHDEEIAALHHSFPGLQLWLDCGVADTAACRARLARHPGVLVVGSEAVREPQIWHRLRDVPPERLAFSLDFHGDRFLGPPELLAQTDAWPERLVVMTLSRVGSDTGPDFTRLEEIGRPAGSRKIFAAGGVRGGEDLAELARRGISGVLVASALHDQRIGAADIAAVATAPATT